MSRSVIIMAAPNGARKTKQDHPNLPVTIKELCSEAQACYQAGAAILHAHVRDQNGKHVLDAGLYRELIGELQRCVPDMIVQMTTEAVGHYTPQNQIDVVKAVHPDMVSVALREMIPDDENLSRAQDFYHWAKGVDIHVQHILYDAEDVRRFIKLQLDGIIPERQDNVLYVLGRYSDQQLAHPRDLIPFMQAAKKDISNWFCCAFGRNEHLCMETAIDAGGHVRVGFENNMFLASGKKANTTAEIVAQTASLVKQKGLKLQDSKAARNTLFN